jgi:hypothetical protein
MTGEEIFTAATRQGLVVSTGILGDLVLPAGTFDPGHADEIGPEGPTVRNRTVAYFLPALSWCRFPSGGGALKGQVQDQHGCEAASKLRPRAGAAQATDFLRKWSSQVGPSSAPMQCRSVKGVQAIAVPPAVSRSFCSSTA